MTDIPSNWVKKLLGFEASGSTIGAEYKHVQRVVCGTNVTGTYDEATKTLTLATAGGSGSSLTVSGGDLVSPASAVSELMLGDAEDFDLETVGSQVSIRPRRPGWVLLGNSTVRRPKRILISTGLSGQYSEPGGVPTITLGAAAPEAGVIDIFDADYSIGTIGGYISEWRGLYGHVARPINKTMTVDTTVLSGARRGVLFNGTSHGMTIEIPELRHNSASLIIAAQFVSAAENAYQMQVIANLWSDAPNSESVLRLDLPGGGSTVRAAGNFTDGTPIGVAHPATSYINTEVVGEAIRDSHGALIHIFANGVRSDPAGSGQIDVLVPQPETTTISIGHLIATASQAYFAGVIRRIGIYGYTHASQLAASALTRDAAWRGF